MEISFPLFFVCLSVCSVFWGKNLVANVKISRWYTNIQTSDSLETWLTGLLSSMVEMYERLLPGVRIQDGHLVLLSFLLPPGSMSL